MLLALPDRGSPWEPSRDCLPDEIAEERVADCVRVGGSVASGSGPVPVVMGEPVMPWGTPVD